MNQKVDLDIPTSAAERVRREDEWRARQNEIGVRMTDEKFEDFHFDRMGPGERCAWSNGYHEGLRHCAGKMEELEELRKEIERLRKIERAFMAGNLKGV